MARLCLARFHSAWSRDEPMPLIAAPLQLHAAHKDSAIVAAAESRQGRIAAGSGCGIAFRRYWALFPR
jgi:hypothetical protein